MQKESTRNRFKRFIKAHFPRFNAVAMKPILEWRYRKYLNRIEVVTDVVVSRIGFVVQAGPFKGMKYTKEARNSAFSPKILGCYESEILPPIEEVIRRDYDVVLDVGSAEGYYAVGLAMALPRASVIAFDIDERCRQLCAQLAAINDVSSRVTISGWCDHEALRQIGARRAFLMCDCEGYEVELLDPVAVPGLAHWDILVELHDCSRPGITPTILSRFRNTHDIQLIDSGRRDPRQYPIVDFLSRQSDRSLAVSDLRGAPQQWAWMTAKTSAQN